MAQNVQRHSIFDGARKVEVLGLRVDYPFHTTELATYGKHGGVANQLGNVLKILRDVSHLAFVNDVAKTKSRLLSVQ